MSVAVLEKSRHVYHFGNGVADGDGTMKAILGGKGAALAEMTAAGLPVPPGFTICTQACAIYEQTGRLTPEIEADIELALNQLEALRGEGLGDEERPLLVSVRSGACISMPGMMDTILNLGLNDRSVEALARRTGNPRFAWDWSLAILTEERLGLRGPSSVKPQERRAGLR